MNFMLTLTLIIAANAQIEITPVPDTVPMIYNKLATAFTTYENFKMVYYVNLTDFYNLPYIVNNTIQIANATCMKLTPDSCAITLDQLNIQYQNMLRDEEEITAQRKTRGLCNWCGTIQHYLIGTMDANHAKKKYADHINKIAEETSIQHDATLNQTILFQTFLKSNSKNAKQISTDIEKIHKEVNRINNYQMARVSEEELRTKTQGLIQIASAILTEHFHMYSQISKSLNEAKNHHIPEFIPVKQLTNDLKRIATTLNSNQRLPVDFIQDNPLNTFKYSDISSALIKDILIIEILLPIAEREKFTLYKATPIPIETPNGRLIANIKTPYFLLNMDQTKYIPLSRRTHTHLQSNAIGQTKHRRQQRNYQGII